MTTNKSFEEARKLLIFIITFALERPAILVWNSIQLQTNNKQEDNRIEKLLMDFTQRSGIKMAEKLEKPEKYSESWKH